MDGITIDELGRMCKEQQKLGNGKKMVLMSSDDECNEFHQAWEGLQDGRKFASWVCGDSQMANCISQNIWEYVVLT